MGKKVRLTDFQKRLCNVLQEGLPVREAPFAEVAAVLGSDEKTVIEQTRKLKKAGLIRRLGAQINYRALGLTGTVVAAHVPKEQVRKVTEAVNILENVSHNYLRKHYYNLWFTLLGESSQQIDALISNLATRFGVAFYSFPAKRVFKLDVRFDAGGQRTEVGGTRDGGRGTRDQGREMLEEKEKQILFKLQGELKVVAEPFDFLCGEGIEKDEVIRIINELIEKGVIRRIGAVVDHYKLAFVANVLFVCEVTEEKVVGAGERLARSGLVSHCYERKTVEAWPYNLYAMMHAKKMGEINEVIDKFVKNGGIESYQLLPTEEELKKQPVKYKHLER